MLSPTVREFKVSAHESKAESQATDVWRRTNLILNVHGFEAQSRPLVDEDEYFDESEFFVG